MFIKIRALIYKEFLAVWRDKKSRFVLIAPPLLQLFIYSFAATLDIQNVTLGILNRDKGERGFELVEKFMQSKTFRKVIFLERSEKINDLMDNEKVMAVLSIEEDFSKKIDEKKPTTLSLILNGRRSNSAQIIQGYIAQIIAGFSREYHIVTEKTELITRRFFNPNLTYNWFTIPGLLCILTMLESLIIVSLSIAREKELGTFDQLLVSPLEPRDILIGKTVPGVVISLIEGCLIVAAALFFFHLPFEGSFLFLLIAMFVFVMAIVGFGLFLSALCNTQQQAVLSVFIFMTPSILLSGFASPIENMPLWLQYVTYLNPARYFMTISRGIFMKNLEAEVILNQIWPMAIIAIVTLCAATKFFRKRLF